MDLMPASLALLAAPTGIEPSLLNDPGFQGAIVGAVAGVVGAVIGGVATYYASVRQYRTEHATKENAALTAVMIEICRNQQTLILYLDNALPVWLTRMHLGELGVGAIQLREATTPIPCPTTRTFDALFVEIIGSPYGPELRNYYDQMEYLKQLSSKHQNGLPASLFEGYVQTLAIGIELSVDITNALRVRLAKDLSRRWGKDDDLAVMDSSRERALLMAALYRARIDDLRAVVDGETHRQLPTPILNADPATLSLWIKMAESAIERPQNT